MFIAILALAMISGTIAAATALIAGWSLLAALALYSGIGVLSVLIIAIALTVTSTKKDQDIKLLQADAAAYN